MLYSVLQQQHEIDSSLFTPKRAVQLLEIFSQLDLKPYTGAPVLYRLLDILELAKMIGLSEVWSCRFFKLIFPIAENLKFERIRRIMRTSRKQLEKIRRNSNERINLLIGDDFEDQLMEFEPERDESKASQVERLRFQLKKANMRRKTERRQRKDSELEVCEKLCVFIHIFVI